MARLRDALSAAGYADVRTLLQSGNVLLASERAPAALERELSALLHAEFGFDIPVVVRTRDELAAVIAGDPFGEVAEDPARYQVSFLSAAPDRAGVEQLVRADIAPELVVVGAREVYAWHPDGLQRSRLAGLITDQRLGVRVTARNWRTVTGLLALADREPT
jgi:uncharacterized protein (DUF1697 family)